MKLSLEVVRPGVVAALERLATARTARDREATVAADVHERPKLLVPAADDDDRYVRAPAGEVRAGLRERTRVTHVLP